MAAVAVLLPLAVAEPLWSSPGGDADWNRTVLLAPFDLALAATVVVAVRARLLTADLVRTRLARAGVAVLGLGLVVALLAHPSPLGLALVVRIAAGVALFAATGHALADRRTRTVVLGTLAGVGVAQALLGMAQALNGEAFGIQPIDFAGPLYPFGTSLAGRGGLGHPYHLAVLLVVAEGAALLGLRHAARRAPWLAALVVIAAGIGITYTRAGLLGQLALLGVALVARRSGSLRWGAAAILVGLLVGGLAFGDGWSARADATAGADPTSLRSTRLREAQDLIRDEPLVGVGPGRYVTAQAAYDREELLPAHNIVAHEAAELGVLGTAGLLIVLLALARRALKGGAWALVVALPMVGFLGLDAFPYTFPVGLALSAIWLALIRDAADGGVPA